MPLELFRARGGLELHEAGERDHRAVRGTHVYAAGGGGVHAVGRLRLHEHAVSPARQREVVSIDDADGGLQRLVEFG